MPETVNLIYGSTNSSQQHDEKDGRMAGAVEKYLQEWASMCVAMV